MAKSSGINPELLLSQKLPEKTFTYTERDAAIYALGVGACGRDAVDADELKYVYHENGQQFIQVLPTFSALFSFELEPSGAIDLPGLQHDPRLLLHGQQYMELYKPFPSSASIRNEACIAGLHDKGKAAILEIETKSYNAESGELLCMNRMTAFLRGAGGFSNSSQPFSYSKYQTIPVSVVKIPKSQPFAVFEDYTQPSQASLLYHLQALVYRLSGDYNPLHSDPMVAKAAGVIYQVKVKERNRSVLSGFVDVHRLASSL
ncbi:Enoyl-CoA hydratase 2 (peroxisomal) [Citrus sinensis]|nr:Enoyl-CoA hydratase 2 (peroxisomal) [Citrus sinensis]